VEVFNELDTTLDRMYSLADRASESAEEDEALRQGLDEEFSGYSHIVARMAGADDFDGPSLSLLTKCEASVARQILGCLSKARHDFSRRVFDQRRRIDTTMNEAIELISRILSDAENITYPTRDGLTELLAHLRSLSSEYTDFNYPMVHKPVYLN
jgi:hypothetical protein